MSLKLEYHLIFIFVLTLTYKECLKLEKERFKIALSQANTENWSQKFTVMHQIM